MPGDQLEPGPAASPPSGRRAWRPTAATQRAHTGQGLFLLVILAVLGAGIYFAISRPTESGSVILAQLTPRPRAPTVSSVRPTAAPGSGGSPIAVQSVTAEPRETPAASPRAEAASSTPGPTATSTPRAPAGTPGTAQPTSTQGPGERAHTVQPGDTLYALALRYGSSVEALMAANDLPERSTPLRVGQRLIVPPAPTRTPVSARPQ